MIAKTHPELSVREAVLFVAFELSRREWKLALTSGFGVRPWLRTIAAGDLAGVARVIAQGRRRFGLDGAAPVVSCYEAGRDGFWIHRALVAQGVANRVVDSSSIEVSRRARRAKTDRIDAIKLVQMLVRVWCGERLVWREVRVPTAAAEAARQVSRERTALTRERTRLLNQMRGWLATWGTTLPPRRGAEWWAAVTDWAGSALPASLQTRLARASERLALVETQRTGLDRAQQAEVGAAPAGSPLARLVQLKAVRSGACWGLRPRRMPAGTCSTTRGSVGPGITGCRWSVRSWPGGGCTGNRRARSVAGTARGLAPGGAPAGSGSSRWLGS